MQLWRDDVFLEIVEPGHTSTRFFDPGVYYTWEFLTGKGPPSSPPPLPEALLEIKASRTSSEQDDTYTTTRNNENFNFLVTVGFTKLEISK